MKSAIQYAKKLRQIIRPPAIEWCGDYSSWAAASEASSGYSESNIAEKAFLAARDVIHGRAAYCRDGVTFQKSELNWPLIAGLQAVHRKLNRPIRVIDYGGAFGDSYLQNREFIKDFVEFWRVSEQPSMVERAKELPSVERLEFSSADDANFATADLVVLSSVLQYLVDYKSLIGKLVEANPSAIFIDRTGFVEEARARERITKQTVRPPLYSASYPCRFFVKSELMKLFAPHRIKAEWDALDVANIPSRYLGMYLEKF